MPGLASRMTALLGAVDRGGNVDTEAEVGGLHFFKEILGVHAVVENGGDGCWSGEAVDDATEVGRHVALPVRRRRHVPPWAERAAIQRIAHVDRLIGQRHFEKLLELGQAPLVVLAAARDGKDNVVVEKAGGVAVSMESVRHRALPGGGGNRLLLFLFVRWIGHLAEADVRLGPLQVVT